MYNINNITILIFYHTYFRKSLKKKFSWKQCPNKIILSVFIIFVILQLSKIIEICLSVINRISSNNKL